MSVIGATLSSGVDPLHASLPDDPQVLRPLFEPASVAIVGASTDPSKFGGRALKFCIERGYAGALYPIHAQAAEVQGLRAYASLAELPQAPDVAVVAVPAPKVLSTLEEAGARGARFSVVYGAQFAEAGAQGARRQRELLAVARAHGMRLVGPNCMGVISLRSGFVASFTTAPEHHDGRGWPSVGTVSVVSQSGAVGIQMFAQLRDRGLGLANWISTGNQADVDAADCIAYFAADPATRTIAVYLEDASRGVKLVQALELARQARKPVVMLKVGTTEAGGMAAAGHTASMYVEDRVVDSLLRQYGVLRARSVNELIDLVSACASGIVPRSPDVAAVSVSGGGAVMIADAAARNGLRLPDFDPQALAVLKVVNEFVNDRNPIDISAPSMRDMAITAGHIEFGLQQPPPTTIGYISHIPMVRRTCETIMPLLQALPQRYPGKLLALAMNASMEDRRRLVESGIAVFEDPVIATECVGRLVQAGMAFDRPATRPEPARALAPMDVPAVRQLLAAYGIGMAPEWLAPDLADALACWRQAGGAIVLKLSAPGLVHRTEVDGVALALDTEEAVRIAHGRLQARCAALQQSHPDLTIVASPMIADAVEFHAGVRIDGVFGPMVFLGSGGTLVEMFDDTVYRKAPFNREDAIAMVDAVRVSRQLDGWRGRPAVDRDALVHTMLALGRLACDARAEFASLEINPLMVRPRGQGVIGVDLVVGSVPTPWVP